MRNCLMALPAVGWFIVVTGFVGNFVTAQQETVDVNEEWPDVEYEALYELPATEAMRPRRAAQPYLGPAGYLPCAGPEGLKGTCKPRATCANYYSTPAQYGTPDKYKSCTFGYGYHGVCCPDVVYSGKKPNIVKIPPNKRKGYNNKYTDPGPQAVGYCIEYAKREIMGPFMNDTDLGRGEDDDSYWGNGVVKEVYMAELNDIGFAGFFILLVTQCLKEKYNYNTAAAFDSGLQLNKYMAMLPPNVQSVCQSFNIQCTPSKYRTIDGTCNNVKYPYWGSARSNTKSLFVPEYPDGLWALKGEGHPKMMALPREFTGRHMGEKDVADKNVNLMYLYFGQFIAHDTSHVYFYQASDGSFIDCCHGYQRRPHQVSPKCYAIEVPHNDPFYSKVQQRCLNLARLALAPHPYCTAGYGVQANRQTSYLDLSAVYGTHGNETNELRQHEYGLMKMSKIGDEYMMPIDANAECFNTSMGFCQRSGDLRSTMHPGITLLQALFLRFHNFCAKKLYYLNPHWSDDKIFNECRRINIAVFQHIAYNEYVPLLLGWKAMYEYGVLPVTDGYSYDYNEYVNPAILAEFSGAAFRHHTGVYGHINCMDEDYKVTYSEMLANTYNNPSIYRNPKHFNCLLRGYIFTPQRAMDKYYDHQISLYLLRDQRNFGLAIAAINVMRGRDYALRSYNDYRELCGYERARTFEDLLKWMPAENVQAMKAIYQHPDDMEVYSAGLMEHRIHDSLLGPTWWCIASQQFKNWKVGDRYFYDRGGPYAFTLPQLDQIRQMSFASLICMVTSIQHTPAFAFHTVSEANPLYACSDYENIPRMDFGPWKSKPKPKPAKPNKAYKRTPPGPGFYY